MRIFTLLLLLTATTLPMHAAFSEENKPQQPEASAPEINLEAESVAAPKTDITNKTNKENKENKENKTKLSFNTDEKSATADETALTDQKQSDESTAESATILATPTQHLPVACNSASCPECQTCDSRPVCVKDDPAGCAQSPLTVELLDEVKAMDTLTSGFRIGHESMLQWMSRANDRLQSAHERETKLKETIRSIELKIANLRLEGTRTAKRDAKALVKANKSNWKDLKRLQKSKKTIMKDIAKDTKDRAKSLIEDIEDRLVTTQGAIKDFR